MGTLHGQHGVPAHRCFEDSSCPELIREIHEDYVAAGARVIETNTFGANAASARHGLADRVNEINWHATQLARQAAKGAFIAGSIGPLGVSAADATDRGIDRNSVCTQMGALLDGGVDLILLETFQDPDEPPSPFGEAIASPLPSDPLAGSKRTRAAPRMACP